MTEHQGNQLIAEVWNLKMELVRLIEFQQSQVSDIAAVQVDTVETAIGFIVGVVAVLVFSHGMRNAS